MASESENRKLNDLRVVDLRSELEKRDLDKTGVKAVLLERLQKVLEEEGHDPETYVFDLPAPDVKRTPGRGKKSDNDEVSEDDKLEEEEETQTSAKKNSETLEGTTNNVDKTPEKAGQVIEEEIKVESENTDNKTPSKEDGQKQKVGSDKSPLATAEKPNDNNSSSIKEENGPVNETSVKEESAEKKEVQPKSEDPKEKTPSTAESSEKPAPPAALAPTATPAVKDEKQTSEANGIIDNEDSINLTIGEDEAKMLADEEDSSQEKDHKDEGHGSSSHKKTGSGEKTQDKTNQEKADGKSSGTGDKITKDEKSKKGGLGVAGTGSGGSSRNLWVSGLATTTRATDLKQVFSKYGKVVGAKVVTNARTPGARCYGYVTMSSADDANRAAQHLHHTELHGRLISVEKAKGDSSGPPKRTEPPTKVTEPAKKVEEKKKEPVVRKTELKKEENIVPPGTEGEVKEPAAPGTEEAENRSREREARGEREREKRPRSENSSHRSRGASPVLTFDKIKEERERIRQRVKERMYREEERRRAERIRQREIERKQREEFERLERERQKLKLEREKIMREKDELLKIKSERQRLERERQKLERERLEKEKEELERLKRQNLRLEEEARRKRSLSGSRDREYKRPATEARYAPQTSSSTHNHHSSAPTRYAEPPRSAEYKKEPTHKSSRDIGGSSRRPGFEPETSRRLVTSVSASSRDSWPPKERESGRYERAPVSSSSFREDSRSSKPSESRHVRERYSDSSKGERFVERNSDSWPVKNFSSRDTWVSGERKPEHAPEPWARPTNNTTRWPSGSTGISLGSRGGPQQMSSPMFGTNSIQNMPSMNMGISMGPFSGGDRFDAYKQPYFKGP